MPRVLVFLILAGPIAAAYALYATGIVVIYQASRVLNLAHGAMATVPAFLVYTMVRSGHVPMPIAFVLGIAAGAAIGLLVEIIFIRRLRPSGPTAQTVGTVAALGVLVSLTAKIWGTGGLIAPRIFPAGHVTVGDSQLQYGQIGLFGVAVLLSVALTALFGRTWLGLAMRGAAENRNAASLVGVDPDRTAAAAWMLGGALAAVAGTLLAAVTSLNPYSLSLSVLPAFVAALVGGLASLPGALVGSAVVGLVIGFVPFLADLPVLRSVIGQVGGAELALAVTAMVVMGLRGQALVGAGRDGGGAARAAVRAAPGASRPPRPARSGRTTVAIVVLALWVFLPGVPFSILGDANNALILMLVGVSLVLLTGWVGQISLAQAAFVGVGAYATTYVVVHLDLAFPFTIVVAALVAGLAAAALGIVALRVRGLYLAVATLIFAWMADSYLFSAPWLAGSGGSISIRVAPIGVKGGYPYFDFGNRRTFYVVALAAVLLAAFMVSNLRRSKTGRAFLAVRGSEVAAASLGIDVTRYKLLAFAISGAIAGVAGNLIATHQQTVSPAQFAATRSVFYLSIAVVGGPQSMGGVAAASILFAGLSEVFFRVSALRGWLDVVSAGLLAVVLLFAPGGLAVAPAAIARAKRVVLFRATLPGDDATALLPRFRFVTAALAMTRVATTRLEWIGTELSGLGRELADALRTTVRAVARRGARGRVGASTTAALFDRAAEMPGVRAHTAGERDAEPVVLEARGVTVRYGGVTACEHASIAVHDGEVVGLIGPNGAGKTTLFNVIAGFVAPESGRVFLNGADVTGLPVHVRARQGMGRTFQAVQLLPELSVRENLLVATHTHDRTGVLSHLVLTRSSARAERAAHERVREVLTVLALDTVADEPVAAMPFGTLRLVEFARALVTRSAVVMLDEPASGLDAAETTWFADLLGTMRARLGLSLLLIEHDIALVMAVCDYVYVLNEGRLIAAGEPGEIQSDPAVVAAYLGQSTRTPAAIP